MTWRGVWFARGVTAVVAAIAAAGGAPLTHSLVLTQVSGERSRLVRLAADGRLHPLTEGFHTARDPDISFDGRHILFSGKRGAGDPAQIFEMNADGSALRPVTQEVMDCTHPVYLSTLYVITSDEPWYQIAFAGAPPGRNSSLYTAKLDGTQVRRITYNPYGDADPFLMPDGRILFAGEQRNRFNSEAADRMPIFGVNLDGTDYAIFSSDEGAPWKQTPVVTAGRLAVFVEQDHRMETAGGWLAAVALRRNLHSYRRLTQPEEGLFQSPSPLPDGRLIVSFRPPGAETYGLWLFDPVTGAREMLFDDPDADEVQARLLSPRPEPDGRSSVVNEEDANGLLYCLNTSISDLPPESWPYPGAKRLRVLEALPKGDGRPATKVLGEAPVESDGSFHVKVPANVPLLLQMLDEKGAVRRSCSWIWARNRESRGCIGCHEDGELTPENRMVDALRRPATDLTVHREAPHRKRPVQ